MILKKFIATLQAHGVRVRPTGEDTYQVYYQNNIISVCEKNQSQVYHQLRDDLMHRLTSECNLSDLMEQNMFKKVAATTGLPKQIKNFIVQNDYRLWSMTMRGIGLWTLFVLVPIVESIRKEIG